MHPSLLSPDGSHLAWYAVTSLAVVIDLRTHMSPRMRVLQPVSTSLAAASLITVAGVNAFSCMLT